jgi:hypothetical protein
MSGFPSPLMSPTATSRHVLPVVIVLCPLNDNMLLAFASHIEKTCPWVDIKAQHFLPLQFVAASNSLYILE